MSVGHEMPRYSCSHCGYSPQNTARWCALGCGSDYNRMERLAVEEPAVSDPEPEKRDARKGRTIRRLSDCQCVCVVCGHTEDPTTAEERWAYRSVAHQWMCDECWHDDKHFPEPETAMRDCDEHCPDCKGSGEIRWNPSPIRDPQREEWASCGRCAGSGAISGLDLADAPATEAGGL